jgi:predicted regulator of Ras-like GTPase activity (Roadblock/LC7/MglB family)
MLRTATVITEARPRTQPLVDRLREMRMSSQDIEASAVVSLDGLIIASDLPTMEEDRLSAMSAAMLSLGQRISNELGRGSLDQVCIRGDHGYVLMIAAGDEAVLTVLAHEEAQVGRAMLDTRRCAADLARIM